MDPVLAALCMGVSSLLSRVFSPYIPHPSDSRVPEHRVGLHSPVPDGFCDVLVVADSDDLDPGYNIFPSLHVANAFLVAFIFFKLRNRIEGTALTIVAVLISISALYVKQHYVVDIVSGLVLGYVTFVIAFSSRISGLGYSRAIGDSSRSVMERRG
jgi:membrane-associated phospholipid phosphatase